MNGRERMQAVLDGRPTDRIPHFEMVFAIPEEAFGLSWPTTEEMNDALGTDRFPAVAERYFHIWDLVLDTYDWDCVPIPHFTHDGELDCAMIRLARERYKDRAMVCTYNGDGTFWMPLGGDAMMEFSIRLYEDREGLHREAEERLARSIELAKRQVEAGAEFIFLNSDYAYNDSPYISPKDFSEIVTPYLKRNVEAIHALGVKAILHSDGDLRTILDQLVSTGIDGYQSIDPQGNMDIAEVKRQYGDRLVLMGNVKTSLLQDVVEEEIRASARYCLENAKPGGRYIFSTSNCLFAGMPLESYHIMLDEYRRYAAY